ncbi:MAG: type II toxin-antitoxin system RelB/DinJ family antitoxin [Candidatus Sungiibacteriota bacterium]|uniref:Type II toxin-antitoxin system RelB/DinJ family antitoxin n=1 Tax=Candidatus Sungiibacteriota bacterium TaxID=2750080 RepID=A0A7T5USD6_9BACT|nr:MAG: type II toxin-antitoxin system RelB/DinJ family antitoxin [Candidatus Sungbacteria bacterium]
MKTLISIKADVDVKKRAQKVAKELGIPLSTIVNVYLKQLGREPRVNFFVPLRPNKKTAELLRRASKDFRNWKNISPAFSTAEEMDEYLKDTA